MNKAVSAGILALLIGFGTAPLYAQAPPAANATPKAVLSQTIRGITVQISGVQWNSFEPPNGLFTYHKSLTFHYSVSADPPQQLPPGKSLLNYVTAVTLIAPDGSTLSGGGGGYSSDASGAITEASKNAENVDPRWPLVGVDIDVLDPAASVRASGRFAGPITILDIPVPSEIDKVTPVHAEAEAPLGTRIIVEKVLLSPKAPDIKTTFVYRVIPDTAAPDLQFGASTNCLVVDDTGNKIGSYGMAGSGDMLPLKDVLIKDALNPDSTGMIYDAGVNAVPSPGAKTMRLTLDANESSELLKNEADYRHFHLQIPLATLFQGAGRAFPPLMARQQGQVAGTIDTLNLKESRYRLRLILRDRKNPHIQWEVRSIQATDDTGKQALGEPLTAAPFRHPGEDDFLWEADGTALSPGDVAREFYFGASCLPFLPGTAKPAAAGTIRFSVNAQAAREQNHLLDFSKLPIPADGQTLTLNRTVTDAFGGHLVLQKIAAYSPEHPLPPGLPNTPAPSGLALVLAEPYSKSGGAEVAKTSVDYQPVDYQLVAANDSTQRRLRQTVALSSVDGDALQGLSPTPSHGPMRVVTLFLRLPAPDAKTFNLRMGRLEQIDLHRSETLTFPDVPAPPKPPAP